MPKGKAIGRPVPREEGFRETIGMPSPFDPTSYSEERTTRTPVITTSDMPSPFLGLYSGGVSPAYAINENPPAEDRKIDLEKLTQEWKDKPKGTIWVDRHKQRPYGGTVRHEGMHSLIDPLLDEEENVERVNMYAPPGIEEFIRQRYPPGDRRHLASEKVAWGLSDRGLDPDTDYFLDKVYELMVDRDMKKKYTDLINRENDMSVAEYEDKWRKQNTSPGAGRKR